MKIYQCPCICSCSSEPEPEPPVKASIQAGGGVWVEAPPEVTYFAIILAVAIVMMLLGAIFEPPKRGKWGGLL